MWIVIILFFRLRSHDVNIKFVTNTTKESKRCLLSRLHKIGFDIKPNELYTSLSAARHVIDKDNLRPMLMVDSRALEDFEGKRQFFCSISNHGN
jgi:ribonucleotide monophosphatase NagD (HAD superfamily)